MARQSVMNDREILELSLPGLQLQLAQVDAAIAGIRSQLGHRGPGRPAGSTDGAAPAQAKHTRSAAARRRMALGQKKRWAAIKEAEQEKPAEKPRRKLSAAARKRIADATRKRWIAFRKAKAQAAKKGTAKKTTPKPKAKKALAPTTAAPATT